MVGPPSFASGHRAKKKQKRSDRMKNKNEVKKKGLIDNGVILMAVNRII